MISDKIDTFRILHPVAHSLWLRLVTSANCIRLYPENATKIIENLKSSPELK